MKTRKEEMPIVGKFVRPIAWGLLFGTLVCALLLLVIAAIMTAQDVPQGLVTPLAMVAAAGGSFFGGLISARIAKENGLLIGALCGLLLYVLIAFTGALFFRDAQGQYTLIKLLILTACGAVGGVIGVNLRKKR